MNEKKNKKNGREFDASRFKIIQIKFRIFSWNNQKILEILKVEACLKEGSRKSQGCFVTAY